VRFRCQFVLLFALPLATVALGCQSSVQVKAKAQGEAVEEETDVKWSAASDGDAASDGTDGDTTLRNRSGGKTPGKLIRPGPPTVTYPGFEVLPNGQSVIVVQVSGPTEVTESKTDGKLVYTLKNTRVPERVNRLPLITREFPTQVSQIELEQVGADANVKVELREASAARMETLPIEGGTLLRVTLPRSEKFAAKQDWATSERDAEEEEAWRRERESDERRSTAADEDDDGTEDRKRTRKARRYPIPMVERPITLSKVTLAPDIGISVTGAGEATPLVMLTHTLRVGITDWLEVEASPNPIRLGPEAAFTQPAVGATVQFLHSAFDIGLRARFFIPIDTATNVAGDAVLVAGLPMAFHLGTVAKIETGAFGTFRFGDEVYGLVQRIPSPFEADAGIPLHVIFQPDKAAWIGLDTGFGIASFEDAGDSAFIPLGVEAGVTAYGEYNPDADFGVKFAFPAFISPGNGDDVVLEDVYLFTAFLRWYYYI
jgi:hypothetical protein